MRNRTTIVEEIVLLSDVKSAYNHFLGNYKPASQVENTTQVKQNLKIVSRNIQLLYAELEAIRKKEAETEPVKTFRVIYYKASAEEERAIANFNADARFTITE